MRSHKFKAWDTVKKVMHSAEELGADQETLSVDGRGFVNISSVSTKQSQFHPHLLPLEYTDRKDSKQAEIYEDDVLKWEYPTGYSLALVCFGEYDNGETHEDYVGGYGWYLKEYSHLDARTWKSYIHSFCGYPLDAYDHVIIGNIHENPSILPIQQVISKEV